MSSKNDYLFLGHWRLNYTENMKSSMKKLLKLAQHAPPYLSSVVSSVKLCSYYRKDFQQNLIVIQSHLCPPFSVLGNPIDFLFFCHLIIDLVFLFIFLSSIWSSIWFFCCHQCYYIRHYIICQHFMLFWLLLTHLFCDFFNKPSGFRFD